MMSYRLLIFGFFILIFVAFLSGSVNTQQNLPYISLHSPSHAPADNRQTEECPLQIAAVGSVSVRSSVSYYNELINFLERSLEEDVELVLRKTYQEVNDLLCSGKVDLAFISSYSYIQSAGNCNYHLFLAPRLMEGLEYTSCIIVHKDSNINTFTDLRGKSFAFTDPNSTLGRLYPLYLLNKMNETPENYFGHSIFSNSSDYAVRCVANNLVDGAAVSSLVINCVNCHEEGILEQIKIIHISPPLALNPLVAGNHLSQKRLGQLKELFQNMHKNDEGKTVLSHLGFSMFIEPESSEYAFIQEMTELTRDLAE